MSACRAVHVAHGGGECSLAAGHAGPHSWASGQGRADAWRSPAAWRALLDAAEARADQAERERDALLAGKGAR
jgi:soluble lytic murein transglycosylase-like protein